MTSDLNSIQIPLMAHNSFIIRQNFGIFSIESDPIDYDPIENLRTGTHTC